MAELAISVDNLGKRYEIAHQAESSRRLTQSVADRLRAPINRLRDKRRDTHEWIWALKDVSFDVRRGEVVGVVGRNGAGKSTLLKVLSRITDPTTGTAKLKGRVGSMLEVGTGFHQELTGRENIYLSGAVLGMSRSDIGRQFDDIVAFAGTAQFLDTPVKRYSSGMQVRLGFAVAAHLDPDILIVDEVLAVGDAEFQRKSLGRMRDAADAGRTVVFVSHDMGAIANLTTRCMYLVSGAIKQLGPTDDVIRTYLTDGISRAEGHVGEVSYYRRSDSTDAPARIAGIRWGVELDNLRLPLGSPVVIDIAIEVVRPISGVAVTAILKDEEGRSVAVLFSPDQGFTLSASPGMTSVRVRVLDLSLAPGRYFADIGVTQGPATVAHDVIVDFPLVEIVNSGQVIPWPERPWGTVHPRQVSWDNSA